MRSTKIWFWAVFLVLQLLLLLQFIWFVTPAHDSTGFGATFGSIVALGIWIVVDVVFMAAYGIYRFLRRIRRLRRLDAQQRASDARFYSSRHQTRSRPPRSPV